MSTGQHRGIRPTAAAVSSLPELGRTLNLHRTRAARAWRRYQAIDEKLDPAAAATAHQAWSDAIEDALKTAEAISREPASSLSELVIQYEAIWWWIGADDNVLDGSTRRWLGRFRRSLQRLAAGE